MIQLLLKYRSLSPFRDIWTHCAPSYYLPMQDTKHLVNKAFQKHSIEEEIKCEVLIRDMVLEPASIDQKEKKNHVPLPGMF